MIRVKFLHEAFGLYENESEDVGPIELETWYDGKTWQEACNDAADCWDWDDEDCINFEAKSDLSETTRSLEEILIQYEEGGEWHNVDDEVWEYFRKAEDKSMGV
tara:strand:+ start:387 stop:698 length:312 start_codon:yes stop_codon:yes gene_type:complete